MTGLSIILVNWNTRDLVLGCIESIVQNPPDRPYDIWLVDNGSVDGSAEAVRQRFPQVHLITNPKKVAFTTANNHAMQASQGRYALMLNVDTIVHAGSLEAMCAYLDQHPDVGAVGCRLLNRDGSLQRSCWRDFPGVRSALIEGLYLWRFFPQLVAKNEVTLGSHQDPVPVDHLLGACIMVPRKVIDQVGPPDPEYALYMGETDWCMTILRAGWKVMYLPGSSIVHFGQGTQRQFPAESLSLWYSSFVHFVRKNSSTWRRLRVLLLKLVIVLTVLVRVGLWSVRAVRQPKLGFGMIRGYTRVLQELPAY